MRSPRVTGVLVALTLSCGGAVERGNDEAPKGTPAGPGETAPSRPAAPGAAPLPGAPSCRGGQDAVVVATVGARTVAVLGARGVWGREQSLGDGPAANVAAFVDAHRRLGMFWVSGEGSGRFVRTFGDALEPASTSAWAPLTNAPIAWAGPSPDGDTMLVAEGDGLAAAFLEPDAAAWSVVGAAPSEEPLLRPSAARIAPGGTAGQVFVAATGRDRRLVHLTASAAGWSTPVVHQGIVVYRDTEIETSGPAVVAHASGDVSIFYLTSNTSLAAVTRRGGVWSPPVTTAIATSLAFVATATRSGDAMVGVSTVAGTLLAVPFSTSTGFGASAAIDAGAYSGPAALAAAPGFCGDDALFVYGMGRDLRFARVNAGYAPVTGVLAVAPEKANVSRVAVATRDELPR